MEEGEEGGMRMEEEREGCEDGGRRGRDVRVEEGEGGV